MSNAPTPITPISGLVSDNPSDAELLAAATNRYPAISMSRWDELGGYHALASNPVAFLKAIGVAAPARARIAAAIELGRRAAHHAQTAERACASSFQDVTAWAHRRGLHTLAHEELWAIFLDARNRIAGQFMIARGGIHTCAVSVRDILCRVVRSDTSNFVLCHNHPGGDACPSHEDVAITKAVDKGCKVLGLTLVDHVIVARDNQVSMLEMSLIGDEVVLEGES